MSGVRSGFMFEPLKTVTLNLEKNEQQNSSNLQQNSVPGRDSEQAENWCSCMKSKAMPTYHENVC